MYVPADPRTATNAHELVEAVRHVRFSHGIACPRCGAREVQRWGSFSGRQRYRCKECRRTFSDLTGTPAAYLKKVELLPAYTGCLDRCLTVRAAASEIGIDPSTAFRWRHRLLGGLRDTPTPSLGGWIELGFRPFAESRKGERFTDRPARQRGHKYGWPWGQPRATVLVACDRLGHVATDVTRRPPFLTAVRAEEIERLLDGRVEGTPVLTADTGWPNACIEVARRKGWRFEERWSVGPAHVRTVRGYILRLVRWLPRFRGVATRYLPNYLCWHHWLDAGYRHGLEITALRWPVGASGFG